MKLSCNIYIYDKYLREREREREREKQGRGNDSCHFCDQYFLDFYVNIQPCCSKTRIGYFNIKIRLLIRET